MQIPAYTFETLQNKLDTEPLPPGIVLPEPLPLYKANINGLLTPDTRCRMEGPGSSPRGFTDFELATLPDSLPLLGFPFHRLVTQAGPYEGLVYSFKRKQCLVCLRRSKDNTTTTQIYHPAVRCGVWVSSHDALNGLWARGLYPSNYAARTEQQVLEDLNAAAGGPDRWRSLDSIGQPAYALTDQGRVYRYLPLRNGRTTNPANGQGIPYELVPYNVNGQRQIGFPPPADIDGDTPKYAMRLYLKDLYRTVWGAEASPFIAARIHGTEALNPHIDLVDTFRPRRRGRPRMNDVAESVEPPRDLENSVSV